MKALLMILDGWGIGNHSHSDVIFETPTPFMDKLEAEYPNSQLLACGENVGLPDGQMGNSEVGHLNIGAKLVEIAKEYGIADNTFVHCFMDGRDTDPKSGKGFIADLQKVCDENGAHIASIIGRFYAMDRDKRWNRVKIAYDQLVHGKGKEVADMVEGVQGCYDSDSEDHKNTDEFMEPLVNANVDGRIGEGDAVIFFNYRNDRAKELTVVLTQQDMPEEGMTTIPGLHYCCMTPYDASFTGVHILFPKENVDNTLGEYLSSKGLKQLHTAETEKYAHVTFFFNG